MAEVTRRRGLSIDEIIGDNPGDAWRTFFAKGQVVAITVSGRTDATMLNFLIPIQEAQDFLGLQIVPPK